MSDTSTSNETCTVEIKEDECDDSTIHTVTFKCIGATRDDEQQATLKLVCQLCDNGLSVPVNIQPEPTNQYDNKAIAFVAFMDEKWQRIGYVVKEALDDVHCALQDGKITKVEFSWVKFLLSFPRSGPGYYAGIKITRQGNWSRVVMSSASRIK